jgi:hypothetical protein
LGVEQIENLRNVSVLPGALGQRHVQSVPKAGRLLFFGVLLLRQYYGLIVSGPAQGGLEFRPLIFLL